MFLLQAEGIVHDLSLMKADSVFAFGAVIVVILLVAYFIIKRLGITHLGPIKREQHGQTTLYNMNEENAASDALMCREIRQLITSTRNRLTNMFADMNVCSMTRRSVSAAVRFPLYESAANNHFTTELMPDNYDDYRHRIIELIKEEYIEVYTSAKEAPCPNDSIEPWDAAKERLIRFVDDFLREVCRRVMRCCEKKLLTYHKYLAEFEASNDDYRVKIIKSCITKNEEYIRNFERRIRTSSKEVTEVVR